MRREVARVAVTAVCIALAVLAVPLAVSVYLLVAGGERGELERVALRAAIQVDPSFATGDTAELPSPEPGSELGLYDRNGRLRSGTGPVAADAVTRTALGGGIGQGQRGGMLVAAVPTSGGEQVTGVIRVASPTTTMWQRVAAVWAALAALMAVALLAALAVARRRARRIAAPLEVLAAASRAVGEGDFGATVAPCGIAEIDSVATTHNTTANRLGALLERERQFTANASHQLRTPLTGLQLSLEAARDQPNPSLDEALALTARLQATIDDVLALHRTSPVPSSEIASLGDLLDTVAARWHGSFAAGGRLLSYDCAPDVAGRALPPIRVGQILDVLLDNALRHGAGQVRLAALATGSATAISVTDEGAGIGEGIDDVFRRGAGSGHGIGLGLARDFAVALGGRLVLSSRTPPVFTLVLPDIAGETPVP
jgi:signal transduction histidine kinase